MNATITTQPYKSGKSLTIYVDSKNMVNELMITLIDAGFIVNYEPRYISDVSVGRFSPFRVGLKTPISVNLKTPMHHVCY